MVFCAECGSVYRQREQNGISYWVCSKNGNGGFRCDGQNIREEDIRDAFVRMYNRLRQYQKEILDFALNFLTEARVKIISQKKEVTEIDADIARLASQSDMYHKLRAKNIMDDISFNERIGDLQNRLTTLRSRRNKLLGEEEETKSIEQLHSLIDELEECPKAILTFDKNLFEAVVDKIQIDKYGAVVFILKGGIKLKEKGKDE